MGPRVTCCAACILTKPCGAAIQQCIKGYLLFSLRFKVPSNSERFRLQLHILAALPSPPAYCYMSPSTLVPPPAQINEDDVAMQYALGALRFRARSRRGNAWVLIWNDFAHVSFTLGKDISYFGQSHVFI